MQRSTAGAPPPRRERKAHTPGIRVHDVTPTGFLVRLNEVYVNGSVKSDGTHTSETIGWIAMTA